VCVCVCVCVFVSAEPRTTQRYVSRDATPLVRHRMWSDRSRAQM